MSREHAAIKGLIGIIAFVVWVAVGRGLIFGGDATYSSVGQQWAFGIWTIAVIVGAVKIYKMIGKKGRTLLYKFCCICLSIGCGM